MSLGGFVVLPDDDPGPLLDRHSAGDVELPDAGDGDVGVAAGQVATQVQAAGLLDAMDVDLVPVFLGAGRRYLTGEGGGVTSPLLLGDPTSVVVAERVVHLTFPVPR